MRNIFTSLAATIAFTLAAASTDANSTRVLADLADGEVCGLDIYSHDVGSVKVGTNPDSCMNKCQEMVGAANTNAVTWTNFQGGTCWCKKVDTTKVASYFSSSPGSVSYVASQVPAGSAKYVGGSAGWAGWDLPGYDIGNVPVRAGGSTSVVAACAEKCVAWSQCFAFTWTEFNGGTCWMKSKAGKLTPKMSTISGYVVRTAIANTCRP